MDGTLAEIRIWAANFAPRNWAFCLGQTLPITSNTALFSLLGNTYGGDARTTFALPNLKARIPIGNGNNGNLNLQLGMIGGNSQSVLNILNMPSHNHEAESHLNIGGGIALIVNSEEGEEGNPNNNYLAGTNGSGYSDEQGSGTLNGLQNNLNVEGTVTTGLTGGGQPFSIMNPFITLNFIICTEGLYPQRS
ncbi:MAG: tail fiber protein [Bacteroidia bacterium]|nr:tail fiber protein [Bacteroidia bacterium]